MNRKILQTAIAILFIATTALQAKTIYVKSNGGNDSNTGDSWNTAYATLQKALGVAVTGDEIWVAEGTYTSTAIGSAAFMIDKNIKLYGSFKGTEDFLSERVFGNEYTSILNGGDKEMTVYTEDPIPNALIDGFKITGGKCGLFDNSNPSPTYSNLTISGITTTSQGGGMKISGSPILNNVTITGNTAESGGGIYISGGSPTLNNVTITGNTATKNGGGIWIHGNSVVAINNSIISGNKATVTGASETGRGGGIYLQYHSTYEPLLTLTNSLISGNTAEDGGGIFNNHSSMILTNVTIAGNHASEYAGGVCLYTWDTQNDFKNTIIWGNKDENWISHPGVGYYDAGNKSTFNNCLVQEELSDLSGVQTGNIGLSTVGSASVFVNPVTPGLSTAGNYSLVANSPAINKGNNSYNTTATDLAGNPRKNGTIDMGAYEFYNTYTVTFNSSGGSAVPAQEIIHGGKVIKPTDPTRGSDAFAGWFTENTYSNTWDFNNHVVTGDMTLYAKWTSTSILDAQASTVSIYPNPAQSTLYIQSAEAVEQVTIYDISGRALMQVANPALSIDINSLATGIYLVKVKTAAGETVKKIVKQ